MFSFRNWTLGAGLFVLGFLIYSWLVTVTEHDIYAYHKTEFATSKQLLLPGSIVAVSNRGRISKICSLSVSGPLSVDPEKAIYFNRLREDFPGYLHAIRHAIDVFEDGATVDAGMGLALSGPPRNGRVFEGGELVIDNLAEVDTFAEKDCERNMAWHLSRGYRVCTVRKALNAVEPDGEGKIRFRTVAVAFAEHSNHVGPAVFERHGFDYTDEARQSDGARCDGDSLTFGAKLRRALDAIDRFSLNEVQEL